MAKHSRYQKKEEEGEEGRPRRRPTKSAPPLLPIFALLVVIGGAIVLARMAAKDQKPEEPPPEKVTAEAIFGDLPVEEPPVPASGGGRADRGTKNRAPSGLADTEVWIEALRTADEAAALLAVASKAKTAGDHATWNTKGKQAKELSDQALESTALWEEELMAKYGDADRQVRQIMSIRSKWFEKLAALSKTTSR
jgi:hypothetical protein